MSRSDGLLHIDDETTTVETERYVARIRTGMSIRVRNLLTRMSMERQFAERADLWNALIEQAGGLGSIVESGALDAPGHAYSQPFAYWWEQQQRTVVLSLVWGFALRGGRKRGKYNGDFWLLVTNADERDDVAKAVFGSRAKVEAR